MAHQVLEANRGAAGLVLLGIPTRGVALAARLAQVISDVEHTNIPIGSLDVTMYRDDLRRQPTRAVGKTEVPVPIDGAVVVLVDDVLYFGPDRTGGVGRAQRPGPAPSRLAGRAGRPGSPRTADPRGSRRPRPLTVGDDERVQVRLSRESTAPARSPISGPDSLAPAIRPGGI